MPEQDFHIGFIGGSGRSGTTILKRIFKQHPSVCSVPECRIMIDPGGLLDFWRSIREHWSPFLYDQRLRQLSNVLHAANRSTRTSEYGSAILRKLGVRSWPINILPKDYGIALGHYDPDYDKRITQLIESLHTYQYSGQHTGQSFGEEATIRFSDATSVSSIPERLGTFYKEMTHSICQHSKTDFFIDDNTWNILYFDGIRSLIPQARLVHIVRDPRDVIASFMQQTWAPSNPTDAAHFYRSIMERWNQIQEMLPEDSYRVIRLEDLVQEPRPILTSLCKFWNLAWSDKLLSLSLNQSNSGRWQTDIPQNHQEEVHDIIEPFLTQFTYE